MKNGKINEFIDILYYGGEILFEYNDTDYFIQGWNKNGISTMVLDRLSKPYQDSYIWEFSDKSMRTCAEEFLRAPIWNGKTFLDIECDITWKDF